MLLEGCTRTSPMTKLTYTSDAESPTRRLKRGPAKHAAMALGQWREGVGFRV
jgi:hypothetical protein